MAARAARRQGRRPRRDRRPRRPARPVHAGGRAAGQTRRERLTASHLHPQPVDRGRADAGVPERDVVRPLLDGPQPDRDRRGRRAQPEPVLPRSLRGSSLSC